MEVFALGGFLFGIVGLAASGWFVLWSFLVIGYLRGVQHEQRRTNSLLEYLADIERRRG